MPQDDDPVVPRDHAPAGPEVDRARVRAAIDEASEEVGLELWYRSCAEPLMGLTEEAYPDCCGAGCEPCNLTLIEVAVRARRILARA